MLKFADYKFNVRVKKSKLVNKENKNHIETVVPSLKASLWVCLADSHIQCSVWSLTHVGTQEMFDQCRWMVTHGLGMHLCDLGQGQFEWQTPSQTQNYFFQAILGIHLCGLAPSFLRMNLSPAGRLRPSFKQNLGRLFSYLQTGQGVLWFVKSTWTLDMDR